MRKFKLVVFFLAICFVASAQKKDFTYEQLFKGAPSNANKPLPVIKWIDGEHYMQSMKDEKDGITKAMSVNAKTGKAIPTPVQKLL
jgi:dipeptidyl-peptidase 4